MQPNNYSARIVMQSTEQDYTYQGTVVLTVTTQYPQVFLPENVMAQRGINRLIQEQLGRFNRYVTTTLYQQAVQDYLDAQGDEFPFRQYGAGLTYEVGYNQNCHLSLYRDQYEYTGGAHGLTSRAADTWDLNSGRLLTLCSFFPGDANCPDSVLDYIIKLADANMQADPELYFENYQQLMRENFNPESFYLSPQGIVIFYQQYDIAAYAVGIVEFTIPYADVPNPPVC